MALGAVVALGARTQTPIVDDGFDAFLFDEEWTPSSAIARVRPDGESTFALTITMSDASLDCSENPTPATRVTLDAIPYRPMATLTTRDVRVTATRDREGAPRSQGFANGTVRVIARTRTPPDPNQTFVVELDLDDVEASQSYAHGLVTVRVCP